MLQPQKFDFNPFATHNDACNRHSVHQLDSRHPGILVAHMLWIYCYTSSKSVVMRSDRRTTLGVPAAVGQWHLKFAFEMKRAVVN